jgi:hypothetical protein
MTKTKTSGDNVLEVYFKGVKAGWEQWLLLMSDNHHDSIYCDRKLEKRHLSQAKERDAMICVFGDLFCAMQGAYDPRKSMDDIRPEDVGEDYLDRIVRHAVEDYAPFAKQFLLIGKGNHESNILKRHHTCLVSSLVHRLNSDHGGKIHVGGYGGWIRFLFNIHKTKRTSRNLKYHHGSGGGGPVTKGVIQTNRQAVYLPDAHVVVNGHTHDAWYVPIARERLNAAGFVGRDLLHFVRTPGYKDEYGDGSGGWWNETWKPPKPLGAVWLRFFYDRELGVDLQIIPMVT